MRDHPMIIVLAEDDDGHARLIERNLKKVGLVNEIVRAHDGQEALDLLQGGVGGRAPGEAVLLLLDINMPRVDGYGVLAALKADPATSQIPVVMLTTTDDPREVDRCYRLGCSVYVTKPVRYEGFTDALTRLGMFLEIVKLPQLRQPSAPLPGEAPPP